MGTGLIKNEVICWPVISSYNKGEKEVYMVLQIHGYRGFKYSVNDGTLLNILSRLIACVIEKIIHFKNSKQAILRSFTILDICKVLFSTTVVKTLLPERNHSLLYYNMT